MIARSLIRNFCRCQRPRLLKEQWEKGRNARATITRLRALWNIPRRFTLVNHRLPLALPQSSGKHQELSRSMHSLCGSGA
jgi:hypothetical protein